MPATSRTATRTSWHRPYTRAGIALVAVLAACGGSGGDVVAPPPVGGSAVASVSVDPTSASMVVGATLTLTATPRDAQGSALTGHGVTWVTSDSTIAGVTSAGLVTAKAVGSATITATSEGKSAPASITVTPVTVATVTLNASSASVVAGQKVSFTAVTKDAAGNVLSGRTVTWGSSASGVAAVDANGTVTGITPGTATITATSGTASASAAVTVTAVPVASIIVTPQSDTIASFGDSAAYSAVLKDANGNVLTGRPVAWTSSNDTVAKVSATGEVTAVHSGTATITASSGGQNGTATVVVPSVAQIVITPLTSSLRVGASETLSVVLQDSNGRQVGGRFVQVLNNSPSQISVNGTVITGVSAGTATVTYQSEGKTATATITVTP